MKFLLLISLIYCLTGCSEQNDKHIAKDSLKEVDRKFYSINSFGTVSGDTSKFIELNCGLYINSKGTLAFKSLDYSYSMADSGNKSPTDIYLSTVYCTGDPDSDFGGKEMKLVVDTGTFKKMGAFYFNDKNHFYIFDPMMDGGHISIADYINTETFQVLESEFYAKDKKHCYFRGDIIEGADVKSFKSLETSHNIYTAFDNRNYFYLGNKMKRSEIKKQNLDSIRKQTLTSR